MPETLEPPVAQSPRLPETEPATEPRRLRPEPRFNPIDIKVRETAKALYLQGSTYGSIAATLDLRPSTIRNWSARDKWPELIARTKLSRGQIIERKAESASIRLITPAQNDQSTRLRASLAREIELQVAALAEVPPKASDLPNRANLQGRSAVLKTIVDAASVIHDWDSQRTPGIIVIGDVERAIDASEDATPIDVVGSVEAIPEATTGSVQPNPTTIPLDAKL